MKKEARLQQCLVQGLLQLDHQIQKLKKSMRCTLAVTVSFFPSWITCFLLCGSVRKEGLINRWTFISLFKREILYFTLWGLDVHDVIVVPSEHGASLFSLIEIFVIYCSLFLETIWTHRGSFKNFIILCIFFLVKVTHTHCRIFGKYWKVQRKN